MSEEIPVRCGWCGEELDGLGADGHSCENGLRVFAALASGDPSIITDND